MELIDAQVHMWLSDRPTRPWVDGYREAHAERLGLLIHAGQSMGPEALLVEMAEAGVDAGVLSPVGVYGMQNTFELETARRYPRKFCVVGWLDHTEPSVLDQLEDEAAQGMVGVRLLGLREQARHDRNEFDGFLAACQRLDLGISLSVVHPLPPGILDVFERYDQVRFQIDHLGVGYAPPTVGPTPPEPFEHLPAVLGLARYPNVSMKLTGAPSLSHERYPFTDIWPHVERIVEAFGPERVMWGSDFTRTSSLHSYWDGTHYLAQMGAFSMSELEWIYGRALRTVFGWSPSEHVRPRA